MSPAGRLARSPQPAAATTARYGLVLLLAAAAGCGAGVQRSGDTAPGDPVTAGFQSRVEAYAALRERLRGQPPEVQRQTSAADQALNQRARETLAGRIRAARTDARQGDIFTPEVATDLRVRLNPELRGAAAADARATIREDAPAKFALRVNDSYPEGAALPTVPGSVLAALPPLPAALEYRIVDTHLILRDAEANLIVDYLFNVMCSTC